MYRVLIFEPNTTSLIQWSSILLRDGHACRAVESIHELSNSIFEFQPSILLMGLDETKDRPVLLNIPEIKKHSPDLPIVIFSNDKTPDLIVESIKKGATEFLGFPSTEEEFDTVIKRLTASIKNSDSTQKVSSPKPEKSIDIVGESEETKNIACRIFKIAPLDVNVMISGETGTGKELIARSIHKFSDRANKPFVAIDCVSLPPNLIESELFGYEKGAFTGATKTKKGLLELAEGGTLFLDEITELDIYLQGKLLRVLQERQFRRVGGNQLINVDVRVVSATNRDPEKAVADNKLRIDLYYRLNVVPIHILPLRERRNDIAFLAEHFIEELNKSNEMVIKGITRKAMNALINYDWPGNVRELQNVILQAVSLSEGDMIDISDLPAKFRPHFFGSPVKTSKKDRSFKEAKEECLRQFCQMYFDEILEKYQGNISKVAREAQISRGTIYKLFKDLDLKSEHISI